jgi:hypothetical protein
MSQVTLSVGIVGVDDVVRGFNTMGDAAENTSKTISAAGGQMANDVARNIVQMGTNFEKTTNSMELSGRRLMSTTAGIIANSVQLTDILGRMASGQMDVVRGTAMLIMNFIQLAAQIWTVVVAESARAIAMGVSASIASGGIGAAWIAAAATAGAVAVMGALALLPRMGEGGIVPGPTVALIGESEPEAVIPLSRIANTSSRTTNIYVTVNEAATPRATGEAVVAQIMARLRSEAFL